MALTIEQIKAMRDELKVKAHLFNAEMKQTWEKVEKDLQVVQAEAKKIGPKAKELASDAKKAAEPLLGQIERALNRIKSGIESNHKKG